MALPKVVLVVIMIIFRDHCFWTKMIGTQKSGSHIFLASETPFCKTITECDAIMFNNFSLHFFFNSLKSVL